MTWKALLEKLSQPFAVKDVFWRAGTVSRDKKRAQALPYAEPRIYDDRLNALCPGLWSVSFKPWGDGRIICELTIGAENEFGGISYCTRASTGEENEGFAPGTAAEAQAFKRACSKFGLGRYLYDVPIAWVAFDAEKRRLLETPALPERFHPQPEPVELVRLTATRASALHKELGKLETVASSEHHSLAGEALGRAVDSFTGLTEQEALEVLNHAKRVHAKRKREGHSNPERKGRETLDA